jgi:Mg-chelatase subunit ChlD
MAGMRLETAAALLLLCTSTLGEAQTGSPDPDLRLIESTERNEDPLGLDEATGKGLEEAAQALPKPTGPALPVAEHGQVMSAIPGVTERTHAVHVRLAQGLAFVEIELTFENRTPHAAQLAYRLAVPDDATPLSLDVCASDCAEPSTDRKAQVTATLTRIRDARGSAFALLASRALGGVTMRVKYVAQAPVIGGRVLWSYPARGFDPRIAPALVHAEASHMQLATEARTSVDAWRDHVLEARVVATLQETRARAVCGSERIQRAFRAAAQRDASVRPTWLVLDASPSMEGPARSRAPIALAGLLAALPESTPLTVFAFGASVTRAGSFLAGAAELAKIGELLYAPHGSASKLSKVLDSSGDVLRSEKPRIVVLSDGQLEASQGERESLERARRRGAELWLIDLSDQAFDARVYDSFARNGEILSVARLADQALSSSSLDRLTDALSTITARPVAPGLRAGSQHVEERRWPARGSNAKPASLDDEWLCALAAEHASPATLHAGRDTLPPAIAALPYEAVAPSAPPVETGMPKQSVLNLLRTQLVPRSRACLRSDRKGRGDYAVGLTFRMTLARREIADAQILGEVPPALKSCLLDILDSLQLPWFSGRLLVNYPIHTEREPDPPTIELAPEVVDALDHAMKATNRDERALPLR